MNISESCKFNEVEYVGTLGLVSGWRRQQLENNIWGSPPPQGTPPPSEPRVTTFFFYGTHPYASKHADSLATQSTPLDSPYWGVPFHVLLQTSCASSESGFQETGFLFTPCHTTREDFVLFLLILEKETLDFHGSNISLFVNYIWSHGP